jgi:hypothetical protein
VSLRRRAWGGDPGDSASDGNAVSSTPASLPPILRSSKFLSYAAPNLFPVLKRSELICSYGGDMSLPIGHITACTTATSTRLPQTQ